MSSSPWMRALHLVPRPRDMINADLVAFSVMEYIDQNYPTFWDAHPKSARVSVRNTIIRAIHLEVARQ